MASAADIAALMVAGMAPPAGNSDIGFHQGVVQSWDELTGVNTVLVNGTSLSNLKCLAIGAGVILTPGDTVGLLRFQSTYFILGRIAAPGAGAALGVRQSYIDAMESTTSATWVDLATFGPQVANVYVGSARRALAFVSMQGATGNAYAQATCEVSGASSIPAGTGNVTVASVGGFDVGDNTATGRVYVATAVTAVQVFDASNGLNQGMNTFTMKYQRLLDGGYTPTSPGRFSRRRLVIQPF
jgi:hypothetical protein